ncbi:hypothetical protein IT774_16220 [Salinimonas marina]|uniref:Uncharacterized protein n=1 Tax=Salinimonas marina TaxID=2785918 RepID=A0A7S9HEI7_9ALTE|nr:hypothetical protein IT774_16220 [Salinimonas marina]
MSLTASWRRFKWGLAIFLTGLAGLLLTSQWHEVAYYCSMAILLAGFALAMVGYAGIFWHRISGLNPRGKSSRRDN